MIETDLVPSFYYFFPSLLVDFTIFIDKPLFHVFAKATKKKSNNHNLDEKIFQPRKKQVKRKIIIFEKFNHFNFINLLPVEG